MEIPTTPGPVAGPATPIPTTPAPDQHIEHFHPRLHGHRGYTAENVTTFPASTNPPGVNPVLSDPTGRG